MTPTRWPAVLLFLSLFVAAGCDSDVEQVSGPAVELDISGVWDFSDVLIISGQIVVCRDTGSFEFEQSGNTFTGKGGRVGTCKGLLGEYASDRVLEIVDGTIDDSTISFTLLDVCECGSGGCLDAYFAGTVQADGRIVGASACSVILDGEWEAGPAAPLVSLEFVVDSVSMVVQETIMLEPIMHSETGAEFSSGRWRGRPPMRTYSRSVIRRYRPLHLGRRQSSPKSRGSVTKSLSTYVMWSSQRLRQGCTTRVGWTWMAPCSVGVSTTMGRQGPHRALPDVLARDASWHPASYLHPSRSQV